MQQFRKGNLSTSLKGLEAQGWVTFTQTLGELAEAVDFTPTGRTRLVRVTSGCE
jgi:hypothetical protein